RRTDATPERHATTTTENRDSKAKPKQQLLPPPGNPPHTSVCPGQVARAAVLRDERDAVADAAGSRARRPAAREGCGAQPLRRRRRQLPGLQAPAPVAVADRPRPVHARLVAELEHVLHRQDRETRAGREREPD